MYTPSHVANYMLERADDEDRPITQMKLQKLVYIAQGWSLALLGKPLFDEPIAAWKHGPVIPSLYNEFKHFGANPITARSVEFDMDNLKFREPIVREDDEDVRFVLDLVWEMYKQFSAASLRNKTHESNTPWSAVYKDGEQDTVIPADSIKEHFVAKINTYLKNAA